MKSWALLGKAGCGGLLHPQGIYDDPNGGLLRAKYYARLPAQYQFANELNLFKGTNDHRKNEVWFKYLY